MIELKLLLISNGKSHIGFQIICKSLTLDDLDGHWQPIRSTVLATAALVLALHAEGKHAARQRDCKYIEISATIGHNVDQLLVGVLQQIRLSLRQAGLHSGYVLHQSVQDMEWLYNTKHHCRSQGFSVLPVITGHIDAFVVLDGKIITVIQAALSIAVLW